MKPVVNLAEYIRELRERQSALRAAFLANAEGPTDEYERVSSEIYDRTRLAEGLVPLNGELWPWSLWRFITREEFDALCRPPV